MKDKIEPRIPYWVDRDGTIHEVDGTIVCYRKLPAAHIAGFTRADLIDARMICCEWGTAYVNENGLHRTDGPALILNDGTIHYCVNGDTPLTILDLLIIPEDIDDVIFTSAKCLHSGNKWNRNRIYQISDPDELTLAILRYS